MKKSTDNQNGMKIRLKNINKLKWKRDMFLAFYFIPEISRQHVRQLCVENK